jgi:hypothetical protein
VRAETEAEVANDEFVDDAADLGPIDEKEWSTLAMCRRALYGPSIPMRNDNQSCDKSVVASIV